MSGRRAFVMVYAVGTLVLVSSLVLCMMDSSQSDIEVSQARMYLALARVNAESGIEYACAFVAREAGKQSDVFAGIDGGPWTDITYQANRPGSRNFDAAFNGTPATASEHQWFYSRRAHDAPSVLPQYNGNRNSQAEGNIKRMQDREADGVVGGNPNIRWTSQFQIALTPEPTYDLVHEATLAGAPTVFYVRSRGEVLIPNPAPNPPTVLGTAYAVQSFILGIPTDCFDAPRVTRMVFDHQPATLTPGPPVPAVPPFAGANHIGPLFPPNPH